MPMSSSIVPLGLRALILFSSGFFLSLLLENIQQEHSQYPIHPFEIRIPPHHSKTVAPQKFRVKLSTSPPTRHLTSPPKIFSKSKYYLPSQVAFGIVAVAVGHAIPWLANIFRENQRPHQNQLQQQKRDLAPVLRLLGSITGVAYASTKLGWTDPGDVAAAVGILCVGLWVIFDASLAGLLVSCGVVLGARALVVDASACWLGLSFLLSIAFGEIGRRVA